jgi:hypothetical protein
MNEKQKTCFWVGIIVFVVIGLFPPWSAGAGINLIPLRWFILQQGLIVLAAGGLFLAFRDKKLTDMRMTTKDVNFLSTVTESLKNDGFVVVHIDYIGGAGRQDYFLVNSTAELEEVISRVKTRDLVSVFMNEAIGIKGKADDILQEQTIAMLSQLQADDSDESVIAVRRDTNHLQLIYMDDWQPLYSAMEIKEWFAKNHNAPIIAFPPPWNNSKVLEAIGEVNMKNSLIPGITVLACFIVFFAGYFMGQANGIDTELRVENARISEMIATIRDIDAEREYGKEYPGGDTRLSLENRLGRKIISLSSILNRCKDEEARNETYMILAEIIPYKEQYFSHFQDSNKIEEIGHILSLAEKELKEKGL